MLQRLSFSEYAVAMALAASTRSEDPHTKVGCCLLDAQGGIISTGYNGLQKGMSLPEWMHLEENRDKKSRFMIHAETNAFARVGDKKVSLVGLTTTPCAACAIRMVPYGVKTVVYASSHPKYQDFREIFDFYGIEHCQMPKDSMELIRSSLLVQHDKLSSV